jgi:hypothetical protein
VYVSIYHRQIFFVKDRESAMMQNQSQDKDTPSLYWFGPSRRVTILRPVSMYYVVI